MTPFETLRELVVEINRRLASPPTTFVTGRMFRKTSPTMKCVDGFEVSIQASSAHYCQPRSDVGPWHMVELGFPSEPMPQLAEWIEGEDPNATQTVWACVPLVEVAKVLAMHGGLEITP